MPGRVGSDFQLLAEIEDVLGKTQGTELAGVLLPILSHQDLEIGSLAFEVLVGSERVDKKELFRKVLQNKVHEQLAGKALQHELVARDPELSKLASERLLGWSRMEQPRATRFFQGMPDTERLALARSPLERARETKPVHPFLLIDALTAVGDFKSVEHAGLIAIGLQSADSLVRKSTVRELGRTFSERAVPYLIEALKDDEKEIADEAKAALERIETYLREKQSWEEKLKIKKGK
ncbi:MAG: HEAT repeat domain-containing protein [Planctomycetota bacterium]